MFKTDFIQKHNLNSSRTSFYSRKLEKRNNKNMRELNELYQIFRCRECFTVHNDFISGFPVQSELFVRARDSLMLMLGLGLSIDIFE
jgi:hypothetical protein